MKISELLREAEEKKKVSGLPSAPSIDDEPRDELDSEDDVDNGELNQGGNEFVSKGGDLGNDLYTLTIYNYGDDWANVNPGTPARGIIQRAAQGNAANEQLVDAYLNQEDSQVANDRMISQMILNARNGQMVAFSVGINADPQYNPPLSKSLVDSDQQAVLNKIMAAGKKYYRDATQYDDEYGFKPGYEADKRTYQAGEALLDVLNNPQFQRNKSITGAQHREKMSAYKQKWLDIINDPNADEYEKEMARDALKQIKK